MNPMIEPPFTLPFTLPFDDPRARDAALTGGKGASLASLTAAGFPVPSGVVVTAACYRAVLAEWPELGDRVRSLPVTDAGRLREACAALRDDLVARPVPEGVRDAMIAALEPLAGDGAVSVRSSATLEDLAGASFAGQHDSYLGVRGLDSVLRHVQRCWASLWEDRAVRYRYEKGFGADEAAMAVVVQRMVPADVAGVAFSMDPITGRTDRVLVTSAWGLGETVVSGEGEVDRFLVGPDGDVVESDVGDKTTELVQTDDGVESRPVDGDRRGTPSLDPDQLTALAALARQAERHYGFPQDVEWAVHDGRPFMLQSRPITEFPARWTRQESAERFPTPITPLTWDFTTRGFHESLAHSLALMGLPEFDGEWFARLDGYIYGNQTAVEVFTAGPQVAFDDLGELAARIPELRERYRWVQELPVHWARDLDRYLLALGRAGARDLAALSLRELWDHVLEVDAIGREYFLPNIAISITQGLLHRLLFRFIAAVVGPEEAPAVYDGLTAFADTKTGLVNRDLHDLYRLAHGEPALRDLLTRRDRRAIVRNGDLEDHPAFAGAFTRFLEIHGHREVEFDAYHPTWSGQPWVVLENLRLMLLQDEAIPAPGARDQEQRNRQHATERSFLARVPAEMRTFASEIIRLARAYTALDDLEHYQTTRLTPPFREALIDVGRRLVDAGVVDRPEDVFFLRRASLEAFVAGSADPDALAAEAAEARAAYHVQLETEPPFHHGQDAEPPSEGALKGLAGAPGVAEGPVRRVHTSDDFGAFEPGSVLVARTTNPAWTPLFYSAVAVVTESGGPLSHGAVTAREIRIPAVMAVRGVLRRLEDGQRVRVNGTAGTVEVLE
jgi:phosphohistidine swiveling domain-containing protein